MNNLFSITSICVGASLGALLRWALGFSMNHIFPTIPLGTWAANVIGGFFIGFFISILKIYPIVPENLRLFVITGFLGGLTTFSTFSAEAANLLIHQEYLWTFTIISLHVIGSISATILGMYAIRLFIP